MGRSLSVSPIKSRQTGYVSSGSLGNGSGEDDGYVDVAIAAVDPDKCLIWVEGGAGDNTSHAVEDTGTARESWKVLARLTSATNLRISCPNSLAQAIVARWHVLEFR